LWISCPGGGLTLRNFSEDVQFPKIILIFLPPDLFIYLLNQQSEYKLFRKKMGWLGV
jgi:hypothetical protein